MDLRINNSVSIILALELNPADPAAGLNMWAKSDVHDRKNYISPFVAAANMAGAKGDEMVAVFLQKQAAAAMSGVAMDENIRRYAKMVVASMK